MLCGLSFAAQMTGIVLEHTGAVIMLPLPCPAHGQHRLSLGQSLYNWAWIFQKQMTKTLFKVALNFKVDFSGSWGGS